MRKRTAGIAAAAVAVVVAAVALPLFQPWRLATDKVVDEAVPGAVPISTTSSSTTPPTVSVEPKQPTLQRTPQPRLLLTGKLITHEHRTSGTVSVLALPDGSRILRIENLDTSDGPDLKVWLSDAQVVPGRAGWHVFDDGKYRSLGSLKGNHGNQNYAIPRDLNLDTYRSVAIWCDRFNVSFGAAALT
ncbi:electron transfer DM13 [Kribbella sp. VKM Ac-2571]|uniref:DM13 domain-containing protein n=1 Tax=Kribbella sp. VKM Ac-2571 TaxID=2512222 RepID=UPI00105C7E3A|nr:DM13 domain-containing protein [Kribbella sp. VKM Ac-2571]TDO60827.1 electron transfer DM13 [Kribbella sp. VKM Ac-2571]